MKRPLLLAASLACIAMLTRLNESATAAGEEKPSVAQPTEDDQTGRELGRKVLAVQRAIEHPLAPESLEAVKALGLDTRYYVMVRGWLSQQLAGDSSIHDAHKGNPPQPIKDRIAFLEKAIRAIDLEK